MQVSDRRYKRDGEQTADFINCVVFGRGAEFAEKYFIKGMKVVVIGRIQTGSYEKWLNALANGKTTEEYEAGRLLEKAKATEPNITNDLKDAIANSNHSKLEGLDYRIKSQDSLERKLRDKAEEKNIFISDYAKKVTDVIRYTSVANNKNFTEEYFKTVESLKKKKYTQVEVTNTFSGTGSYKGVNTLMKSKDGYVFELQFHTPESLKAKKENHKLYEEAQLSSTSEVRKIKLYTMMRADIKEMVNRLQILSIV